MDCTLKILVLLLILPVSGVADTLTLSWDLVVNIVRLGGGYGYYQESILKIGADRGDYEARFLAQCDKIADSVPSGDTIFIQEVNAVFFTEASPVEGLGQWIGTTDVWARRIKLFWDTLSAANGLPTWTQRQDIGESKPYWGAGLNDTAAFGCSPPTASRSAYEAVPSSVDTNSHTLTRIRLSTQTLRYFRDNAASNFGWLFGAVEKGAGGNHNDRELHGPNSAAWIAGPMEGYLEVIYTTEFSKQDGLVMNGIQYDFE